MGMGLGLKTKLQIDLGLTALLHAAFGILLPLGVLLLVGCQEQITEEDPSVGAEVSEQSVLDELYGAIGDHTPATLSVGAYALYEQNIRVETSAVVKLQEVATQLKERQSFPEFDRLVLEENSINYQEDNPKVTQRQIIFDVDKQQPATMTLSAQTPESILFAAAGGLVRTLADVVRVSFHSLKKSSSITEWTTGCDQLPTCRLRTNEVKFSVVSWHADNSYDKNDLTFRFSPDIPRVHRLDPPDDDPLGQLTGAAISYCENGKIRSNDQSYFVNTCWVLRDFRF